MWIWANIDAGRLPSRLVEEFQLEESSFAVSTVSIWETMVAIQKGRVLASGTPEGTVRTWLAANPFQVIPIDAEIAILSRTLPFEHDDPADRFIAATAHRFGYPLATADARLRSLGWLSIYA
jgi:PIN domain nuclease of toxin-antitoxin system